MASVVAPSSDMANFKQEEVLLGRCSSDRDLIDGSSIRRKHLERVALSDRHKSAVGAPAGCHQPGTIIPISLQWPMYGP